MLTGTKLDTSKESGKGSIKDKNNMKAKKFANKFGVSVEEMCRITELSRQGLNDIVSGKVKTQVRQSDLLYII